MNAYSSKQKLKTNVHTFRVKKYGYMTKDALQALETGSMITNSFDYSYTNGPLEGTHTKIKTLKRISYGLETSIALGIEYF